MKISAKLYAKNDGVVAKINAVMLFPNSCLSINERKYVKRQLQRKLAEVVSEISYCDFGPENTHLS